MIAYVGTSRGRFAIALVASAVFAVARLATVASRPDGGDSRKALVRPIGLDRDVYLDSLNTWNDIIEERDVFSTPRGGAVSLTPTPPAIMPAARLLSSLKLQGVVGSANKFRAILTGVAGREESVLVAVGDSFPGFRITRIARNSMSVRTVDSTVVIRLAGTTP